MRFKGTYQFNIIQGDDFSGEIEVLDDAGEEVDISTGYTAMLQARSSVESETAVIDLDEAGGLTLGDGKITLELDAAATALLDFSGALVFDCKVTKTADSTVFTPGAGEFFLRKAVTRSA